MANKRPVAHIKCKRKDGKMQKFKNYKGDPVEAKWAPCAVLWPSDFEDGSPNVQWEQEFKPDPENYYYTLFPNKPRDVEASDSGDLFD